MTECRFFICFVVKLFFCDLNSSTTVEVDRGQDLHTTEVSGCDLLGLHTHVDQLVLYTLSTLVRKPHVVLRSTSSAVSITSNEDATVVLDSELSKRLHVYEVLQHSNLGLVQVEEHRDWKRSPQAPEQAGCADARFQRLHQQAVRSERRAVPG